MNNQRIDIDGDTATTDVLWFYLTTDDDGVPTVLQAGRYTDDVSCASDGEWKLKRHDITRLMGRSPTAPPPETRLDRLEASRCSVSRTARRSGACSSPTSTISTSATSRPTRRCSPTTRCGSGNLGKATGPAEIEALLVRTMEVYPSDLERTHHLVMNEQIDVDGDTRDGEVELGLRHPSEGDAPVFEMLGHYRRRPACAHRTAGASSAAWPTATSPTSRSTASSDPRSRRWRWTSSAVSARHGRRAARARSGYASSSTASTRRAIWSATSGYGAYAMQSSKRARCSAAPKPLPG